MRHPRAMYTWGTGQVGREALRHLRGHDVAGFVDNDAGRWGHEIDGLTVVPPAFVLNAPRRPFVVIASMYEEEIAAQLHEATWMAGTDFASIAAVVGGDGDRPLDAFSRIFEGNTWCGTESRSGGGSSLGATRAIRAALPSVMQRYGIRSVLDAPCGDLNWMATLLPDIEDYTGADVVPQLVEANRARYGSSRVRFLQRDLSIDPLPSADLILCRDCLVHLPTRLAMNALRNMARTGSRYLLTTTFPGTLVNRDILTGAWRPLNLQRAPFHFGEPLEWLPESARADGPFADKALAMWALDDVRAIVRALAREE